MECVLVGVMVGVSVYAVLAVFSTTYSDAVVLFEVSRKLVSLVVLAIWSPVLWGSWYICLSLHPVWLALPPEISYLLC